MPLTTAIAAKTAAETSAAISLSGPTMFVADDLSTGESVKILRIRVDGVYEDAIVGGAPVVMTREHPGIIYEGYAEVKVEKPVTANNVAVGYAM